jgi:hypothetical protein
MTRSVKVRQLQMIDAASCGGAVDSLPHLSLLSIHQRRHGSVYAVLSQGTLNPQQFRATLGRYPLAGGLPVYAVDVSVVARCDAEARPGRAYYHHPSRHSAGKPIVAGWAYSWVAQLGTERSSWTAPVDAVRLAPGERPEAAAIRQVQALAPEMVSDPVPLFVFDAGYSPPLLTVGLAETRATVLVRFRDDRVFFRSAQPPARGHGGRPQRHGAAFRCADVSTWGEPNVLLQEHDAVCGVGLTSMTLLHLAESLAGRRRFVRWANDIHGQPVAWDVGGCSEGFDQFEPLLAPLAREVVVGTSRWRAFPAQATALAAAAAIRANPGMTHCPDPSCLRCRDAIAGGPADEVLAGAS